MRKSTPGPVLPPNPRSMSTSRSVMKPGRKIKRKKNPFLRISLIILAVGLIINAFNGKPSEISAKILYNGPDKSATQYKEVRASHILVNTKEEALELRKKVLDGKDFIKDFQEAAKESSKCPSGTQGGDLGYFERGMMVPSFEKAAFNLSVGEISEPVKTEFGWHLIIVTDKQ